MACRYIQVQPIKKVNHVFASKLNITKNLLLSHHFSLHQPKLTLQIWQDSDRSLVPIYLLLFFLL